MLQNFISSDLLLTIIGQCASFCGLLVCLTMSMYGGNEQGKMPETYTYEQFIEYRRAHGTEATRKKLQEIEEQRLEKARNNKKSSSSGGHANKGGTGGGGKHLSKHHITTTGAAATTNNEKKQCLEDNNKSKKEKPKKFLDHLGFSSSSRSKKARKKDSHGQSDRSRKSKTRSVETTDEVYLDDGMRRHQDILHRAADDHHDLTPLVALPEGGHHIDKSHTGSTSPSTKSLKPPSLFSHLDTSGGKQKKRFKIPGGTSDGTGTSRETLTARETKTIKERKLQPVAFPLPSSPTPSTKSPIEDEFTPTVFEVINAPVKPIIEKPRKPRKMLQLGHNKGASAASPSTAPLTVKEKKKKNQHALEEDKTVDDDLAVDIEDEGKPKQKDLKKIKEKLKENHQKMIERQAKIEKKKKEQKKLLAKDDSKKHFVEPPTDRATSAAKKKQKRKSNRSSNKKDHAVEATSKPSSDNHKKVGCETTMQQIGAPVGGTVKTKSPARHQSTPATTESKDTDKTDNTREVTAECDRTEEDEEFFNEKDEKIVRGFELRKVQSAKRFVERPPEKLRITASARIFGHLSKNPRTQKASLKAIKKMKKATKKFSTSPHSKSTVSKSKASSTSPSLISSSSPAPSHSVTTTTWASTTTTSASSPTSRPSTSKGTSKAPSRSASTTTWSSTTREDEGRERT